LRPFRKKWDPSILIVRTPNVSYWSSISRPDSSRSTTCARERLGDSGDHARGFPIRTGISTTPSFSGRTVTLARAASRGASSSGSHGPISTLIVPMKRFHDSLRTSTRQVRDASARPMLSVRMNTSCR
jgi:hypothetical protein